MSLCTKLGDWSSGMIPASGAGGREFDSRITPFVSNKKIVRTGTRTQNLLLRRQAPYPLGHTDNYEFCLDHTPSRTRHSSLGVEHSLSKRKVVGSNPACGFCLFCLLHRRFFYLHLFYFFSFLG